MLSQGLRMFGATIASANETYLGCPVNVPNPACFQVLIDKVESRLQSWNGRLLSQADRLVSIKSVIEYLL